MAKLVVFGGSGVLGSGLLPAASNHPGVEITHALQRRWVGPELPRVSFHPVQDFGDLSAWHDILAQADAVIFALGISQSQVNEPEYRHITLDYPLEAARQLARANPKAAFIFVSGAGADPSGRSRMLFARVKGEAENRLAEMNLARLVIARPGGLVPETWPRKPMVFERLTMPIARLLLPVLPKYVIRTADAGDALVKLALDPEMRGVLENADLQRLVGNL